MLSPAGVTVRQYSLLYEISAHKECSVSGLAEATELERSTLARSLKPLIKQGLVLDTKKDGKRDSKLILTEKGEDTKKQAEKLWAEAQALFEEKLGTEKLKAFEDALLELQNL